MWMNRDEKTVNKEQWLLQNILLEIFLSLHCHTNENKQTKLAVVYKRYNRAKCCGCQTMHWHLHRLCRMPTWDSWAETNSECKYRYINNTPFYTTYKFEEGFNYFAILCMILFTTRHFCEISKNATNYWLNSLDT